MVPPCFYKPKKEVDGHYVERMKKVGTTSTKRRFMKADSETELLESARRR